MNVLKALAVALLCTFSIAVLLALVVPAASLLLGLGIDIPNVWPGSGEVLFFYSHPWVPLLVGILLLALFGRGIWKLSALH